MNVEQFSNEFDTLVNAYARSIPFGGDTSPIDIRVDEYEKSLFLTKAQKELVVDYYSGQSRLVIFLLPSTYLMTEGNCTSINCQKPCSTSYLKKSNFLRILAAVKGVILHL